MSEFKYGIYTVQDPNDNERQVLVDGLEKMEDWDDLKIVIEPCLQKIYDQCKGSHNDSFKMLTWEFQQFIAMQITIVRPPCIRIKRPDLIEEQIRAKTVRAIEDATRRIEIKDFFRCERYIREEEKKHES